MVETGGVSFGFEKRAEDWVLHRLRTAVGSLSRSGCEILFAPPSALRSWQVFLQLFYRQCATPRTYVGRVVLRARRAFGGAICGWKGKVGSSCFSGPGSEHFSWERTIRVIVRANVGFISPFSFSLVRFSFLRYSRLASIWSYCVVVAWNCCRYKERLRTESCRLSSKGYPRPFQPLYLPHFTPTYRP